MAKVISYTKKTTHENYDAAGNLIGKTVVTEEMDSEEIDTLEEGCDEDGCLCDECLKDEDGVPIQCNCDDCMHGDECDDRCYADAPECGAIDEGVEGVGDCENCCISSGCKSNVVAGDKGEPGCACNDSVDIAEISALLSRVQEAMSASYTNSAKPRMVVLAGTGLEDLAPLLAKLGVKQ